MGSFAIRRFFLALFFALGLATPALCDDADPRRGSSTGLPIPRYVALGSSEVNVRTGPGSQYPIAWIYQRRGLPVEVIAEFEYYRKIRDQDGAEGWVHKNLLSGRRTAAIIGQVRPLYKSADPGAAPVLFAEPGVQGRLNKCQNDWCELEIAGQKGFMPRQFLYGIYAGEIIE